MLQINNIRCSFHFVEENNINWLGVELLAVTNVLEKLGSKLSPAVFNAETQLGSSRFKSSVMFSSTTQTVSCTLRPGVGD